MKYYLITFGCQMNKSDSERIASLLENSSYKETSEIGRADLIVVNMCSVRQSAVDRVLGLGPKFQKIKIKNRRLKTVLTGCFLKKDEDKFLKIFDEVVNINLLFKRLNNKSNYLKTNPCYSSDFSAYVPIMTGCNNFCAYCVVPHTRGREASRQSREIVCEVKKLIKHGYKEIWLLGQNVNSYKSNRTNFPKLLKMVNNIPGNFWIRFTSTHPKDFSDELIGVMAKCKKVTPYLNLPVQAGDNKILRAMNRPYTIAQYKKLVWKIRKKILNITLSTDIIVGFPGETKKQFENSIKLFEEIKYDMAYIAEYSPRTGTAAAKIRDDVSRQEKTRRRIALTGILKKTALAKNRKAIGKIVEALIDTKKGKDVWLGKASTYKTIEVKSPKILLGRFVKIKVTSATPWGLKGKLVS